jgi:threonine dehydratase
MNNPCVGYARASRTVKENFESSITVAVEKEGEPSPRQSNDTDEIVLVADEDMREVPRWLQSELGIATDLSGAASITAPRSVKVWPEKGRRIRALVCGAGPDGLVRIR